MNRSRTFGVVLVLALLAFEIFNYSTTEFALLDLLGNLSIAGVSWATILAIAFCGIDLAGIARLFSPETGEDEPAGVMYLLGAWLLAASLNALLTWHAATIALSSAYGLSPSLIGIAIQVAVVVWISRILIIGVFAFGGDRLFRK